MSVFPGRFEGRCAIVTGGASGLGKQVAARIVAEGGKVALWDLNADALDATKDEIGATHVQALDVSDEAAVAAAAKDSAAALGKIDILVCSAGITGATHATANAYAAELRTRLNRVFAEARALDDR